MRWPPVEPKEHNLVDPVGDEEEQEGHGVDGEHPSGVRHRHEKERENVRVARLVYRGEKRRRKEAATRNLA